ncbi:hypothetical protein DM819_13230 [Pseudomonas hunanensis]|uniref:DUF1534 domain-containing protein n=1 Tax=Pseudomonas hunanensis TaxID=1247546 RepID=A0ABD6N8P3_9PSED|nr:hypothetical protein [Pseudomonas hunanensis]PTV58599.1 hypothetical protein DBL03_18110 [Pseudomonas putida]
MGRGWTLWERPCVAKGGRSAPTIVALPLKLLGPLCGPIATQGRSHRRPHRRPHRLPSRYIPSNDTSNAFHL